MDILDIKFMNDKTYLLKKFNMSSKQVEKIIKEFNYSEYYAHYKNKKCDKTVEDEQFPVINLVFYKYIYENELIPSPKEIVDLYFEFYESELVQEGCNVRFNGSIYKKENIIGRILRTYPSLIRDFHFYLLATESKMFDKVFYSYKDDINGKDITIKQNDIVYVISLFVNTKRSRGYKIIKNIRRHEYINEIQLPLNLNEAYKCGDFMLYRKKDLENIKIQIDKLQQCQREE